MPQKKKQASSNVAKASLFDMVEDDDDLTGESLELVTTDNCIKDTYDVDAESPYEGISLKN
jgi:hypothetical protein